MQAVILAAGRGTRMGDLVEGTPKVMLEVAGKPLLQHKLDALPEAIGEVILVVGYLGSVIQRYFGGEYNGKRILYAFQENPVAGTADALNQAQGVLQGKFVVMMGDDLYAKEDVEECIKHEWAILVQKRDDLGSAAKVIARGGRITSIKEAGEHKGGAGHVNTGLYVLDERYFGYSPVPKAPGSSELGLPQTIMQAAKDIKITPVEATFWMQITAPEDLEKAEQFLTKNPI